MTPRIEVETKGAPQAAAAVQRVGQRAADIRRLADRVNEIVRRSNARTFATQDTGQWPALSPASVERKTDPRPMVDTGTLFRSLTSRSGPDQIDVREPSELRLGTSVPYARFHQAGRGVPKRAVIDLRPDDRRQIAKLVQAYVAKGDA